MKTKLKKNSFIEGTIIASLSIIFVKILGALYVIPFYNIIDKQGGALYSYAYTIYNLFLNISTAGIPIALSMVVSEFCTKEMYEAKERTYSLARKIVLVLSVISFLTTFIFSKQIALFITSGNTGLNTIDDISLAIKAISACLLITPILGTIRGYLQGHKFIAPSSSSQIIEQVIRIIVVILGSYLAIKVYKSSISIGVGIALTGAFIGALAAYIYLKVKIKNSKEVFITSTKKDNISNKEIINKIITYCIPIVLISIISNLYETIDLKLIIKGLNIINIDPKEVEVIASVITTWSPKICVVITSVSMGLITSLIPHIIGSYIKKDMRDVNHKFNQAIGTMLYATIPMTLAIIFLSSDVYYLFYGQSNYGPTVLKYIAIVNLVASLVTIMNTVLQGMSKFKLIYISTIIGLAINTLLDIPLILLFNNIGIHPYVATMVASIIGYSISFIIVAIILNRKYHFSYKNSYRYIKKLIIPTIVMTLFLIISNYIKLEQNLLNTFLRLIIFGGGAMFIYLLLTHINKSTDEIFGSNIIDVLKRKLKKTS